MLITSKWGVKLNDDLNWGYQIVYDNVVIKAIHDSVQGPRRTPECGREATATYEKYCRLFERAQRGQPPTEMQLYVLAEICQVQNTNEDYGKRINGNRVRALVHRGVIRRRSLQYNFNYLSDFEPVFA
jgi:hypothetical protein